MLNRFGRCGAILVLGSCLACGTQPKARIDVSPATASSGGSFKARLVQIDEFYKDVGAGPIVVISRGDDVYELYQRDRGSGSTPLFARGRNNQWPKPFTEPNRWHKFQLPSLPKGTYRVCGSLVFLNWGRTGGENTQPCTSLRILPAK